jgi:hypothetical protein
LVLLAAVLYSAVSLQQVVAVVAKVVIHQQLTAVLAVVVAKTLLVARGLLVKEIMAGLL